MEVELEALKVKEVLERKKNPIYENASLKALQNAITLLLC